LVRSAFSCFFSFLFVPFSPVFCKDLNVLIRLLYSVSESDRAVFIDAHNYAELVTQKISAGLSDDVVRFVKKSAADLARKDMLQVVRVLKSTPPDKEYAELFHWCTNNMKPAAEKLVRAYADAPAAFDKLIDNAKHD
jgi:hypothetical protein